MDDELFIEPASDRRLGDRRQDAGPFAGDDRRQASRRTGSDRRQATRVKA